MTTLLSNSVYSECDFRFLIDLFCFAQVELNEIESRSEEYALTRSFCYLISILVESSFPTNLGAGLRPPGFDPYLRFLRDSVFLRFPTRAYRRAAEKVRSLDFGSKAKFFLLCPCSSIEHCFMHLDISSLM